MRKKIALAGAIVLTGAAVAGLAGCGDDSDGSAADTSGATTAMSEGSGAGSVTFSSPMDGATVGQPVTATVDLQGFEIDQANVGKAAEEGHGHLHFSMDGGKFDFPEYSGANGELAVKLGTQGKYSPSVEPTITYSNLPAGEHTLEVYLANNDHSDTGAEASVTFTVEKSSGVSFTSPKAGATTGRTVTAKVALTDFVLDAADVGKAAKEGRGHLHFQLDGGKFDFPEYSGANGELAVKLGTQGKYSPSVEPVITYRGLPAGKHTLKVFLANNDHSDAGPVATTSFTVK